MPTYFITYHQTPNTNKTPSRTWMRNSFPVMHDLAWLDACFVLKNQPYNLCENLHPVNWISYSTFYYSFLFQILFLIQNIFLNKSRTETFEKAKLPSDQPMFLPSGPSNQLKVQASVVFSNLMPAAVTITPVIICSEICCHNKRECKQIF